MLASSPHLPLRWQTMLVVSDEDSDSSNKTQFVVLSVSPNQNLATITLGFLSSSFFIRALQRLTAYVCFKVGINAPAWLLLPTVYSVPFDFSVQRKELKLYPEQDQIGYWESLVVPALELWSTELLAAQQISILLYPPTSVAIWPPEVWRRKILENQHHYFGYIVEVSPNEKSDGLPFVLLITGGRLPDSKGERKAIWLTKFANATPKNRSERRELGRTTILECSHIAPTAETLGCIVVGSKNSAPGVWTPHLELVVGEWFKHLFQPLGYTLEIRKTDI